MTNRWTNQILDQARTVGDPEADAVIEAVFRARDLDAVNGLLTTLILNDGLPSAELPPVVTDYLAQTAAPLGIESHVLALGQEVFGVLGPEVLLVLGFYSLPADYAAKKGVQVLYRTGRLTQNPVRRVFETAQMVVDVMSPGGLGSAGRGLRSAQKVRLMHAAIRHLLTHDVSRPWDETLGVPVCQEDLAGTLMSFSFVVLDGLRRLGVALSSADQDAYFQTWLAIGRLMGIQPELIPQNLAEGEQLTALIHKRQIAASSEGVALATALMQGYEHLLPGPLRGVPASLIHFFLDHDPFSGQNVAAMLGIPPADWTRLLPDLVVDLDRFIGLGRVNASLGDRAVGYVSRCLVEGLLLVERGGRRAPFTIPDSLLTRWGMPVRTRSES